MRTPSALFKSKQRGNGFTLIELLIVVAILGVLAAVGIPMLTGYIADSRRSAAESGLRAIYLMQQDYKREEGAYLTTGSSAAAINTTLFSGDQTLDETGDYRYSIRSNGAGYRATATSTSTSCTMQIDQANRLTKNSSC